MSVVLLMGFSELRTLYGTAWLRQRGLNERIHKPTGKFAVGRPAVLAKKLYIPGRPRQSATTFFTFFFFFDKNRNDDAIEIFRIRANDKRILWWIGGCTAESYHIHLFISEKDRVCRLQRHICETLVTIGTNDRPTDQANKQTGREMLNWPPAPLHICTI